MTDMNREENRGDEQFDAALESFATFLPPDHVEVNDDLVEEYVHTEHLSGMLVMDADSHMTAHYDIDGRDPLMLWREELACSSVASMYRGSRCPTRRS